MAFKGKTWDREAALAEVRAETDTVMLSFSRGKDSLAAWCILRDHGFKVVAFHMVLIPGLQFVEDSLRYYEDHFGQHIYRVLHPMTYGWLKTLCSQPPYRLQAIESLELPDFDYEDVNRAMKRTAGLPPDTWTAVGTRLNDNPIRRMQLSRVGPLNRARRALYPIFDFDKGDLIAAMRRHGVRLPVDYEMFGRSFEGVDYRYLAPLRERFPDDYARILEWFPMQDMEFARAEFARRHEQR